jgi:hypothetical protein
MSRHTKKERRECNGPNKRHLIQWMCVGAVLLTTACNQKTASTSPTATTPALADVAEVAHLHGAPVADQADVNSLLAAVRVATAKYHDVEAAAAAGYQLGYRGLVTGCVANPGVGAMGYPRERRTAPAAPKGTSV